MKKLSNILSKAMVHISGFAIGWQIANHFTHRPIDWLAIGLSAGYMAVDFTRIMSEYK